MSQPLPDWMPEWSGWLHPNRATDGTEHGSAPLTTGSAAVPGSTDTLRPESLKTTGQAHSVALVASSEWHQQPTITIIEPVREDRSVNRKLRGIHLFVSSTSKLAEGSRSESNGVDQMITVNGTLGTGLYWRGGQILELGGPLAVLLSFLLVGLLAWAVMQCITELLCIWPIPGALNVYVSEFVDVELGIATGIAYWSVRLRSHTRGEHWNSEEPQGLTSRGRFTYSVSFAALIATVASEFNFWMPNANTANGVDAGFVYVLIPLILVGVNAFGIEVSHDDRKSIICTDVRKLRRMVSLKFSQAS